MAEKKLISWNVNGIRACIGKGFSEAFAALDADILCLQETKVQACLSLIHICNFINPISQMSNQFNSIVNALAGAERIFTFMDEEPEPDDGYVTLVNAKEENGEIVEVKEHTGMWAWKHPHGDGTLTYTKMCIRDSS